MVTYYQQQSTQLAVLAQTATLLNHTAFIILEQIFSPSFAQSSKMFYHYTLFSRYSQDIFMKNAYLYECLHSQKCQDPSV